MGAVDDSKPSRDSSYTDTTIMISELADRRRVRDAIPRRLWAVAVLAFWERAAFWGATAPWQNYMENPGHYKHGDIPGALGLGQAMATRIYCCFYIFYYVSPVLIAIVADTWLGHYNTLVASVIMYCLGLAVLTISSMPMYLDRNWGLPGLIVAMVLIGLGGGGVKAIMPPFIADQYTPTKSYVKKLKSGEEVVTDRELTLQYIYSLYFWIGNLGSLSWFATVLLEKHYGFTSAYGMCLGFMMIVLLLLVAGKPWYARVAHNDGTIIPQAARIVLCAIKNGWKMDRAEPDYQKDHEQKTVSWTSKTVQELTRGLRACRVLLAFVVFYVCFDQMQNNLISQAGQMKSNGTPNDLVPAMNQVGCIVLGPLVQSVLYPLLHRYRIYMKPISRITIGFGFISLSMLYATAVQHMIYTTASCSDMECNEAQTMAQWKPDRPNVWIQAPVYFLIATGEIFAYTTALEYAYDHSPGDMKVIVQAISLLIAGIGSAVALALTSVAHDPNFTIFYASLSGAMAVTTVIFWLLFRRYDMISAGSNEPESMVPAPTVIVEETSKP